LKAYLKGEKKGRNGLKHNELPVKADGKALILKAKGKQFTLTDEEEDALVNWVISLK
jgi:hypothetical protein